MMGGRLANLTKGNPTGNNQNKGNRSIEPIPKVGKTQEQAAEALKISVPSVKRAKQVLANDSPELINAVDKGEVAVSKAASVVDLPKE